MPRQQRFLSLGRQIRREAAISRMLFYRAGNFIFTNTAFATPVSRSLEIFALFYQTSSTFYLFILAYFMSRRAPFRRHAADDDFDARLYSDSAISPGRCRQRQRAMMTYYIIEMPR